MGARPAARRDADKDQTYFLWVLDQEQLRHTASRWAS
jgi:tRNA U34 2-thiouridine synthase MnmA/TrmU